MWCGAAVLSTFILVFALTLMTTPLSSEIGSNASDAQFNL